MFTGSYLTASASAGARRAIDGAYHPSPSQSIMRNPKHPYCVPSCISCIQNPPDCTKETSRGGWADPSVPWGSDLPPTNELSPLLSRRFARSAVLLCLPPHPAPDSEIVNPVPGWYIMHRLICVERNGHTLLDVHSFIVMWVDRLTALYWLILLFNERRVLCICSAAVLSHTLRFLLAHFYRVGQASKVNLW